MSPPPQYLKQIAAPDWAFTVRTHSMKYTFIKELTPGNHRVEFYLQAEDESRLILNDVPNNKGTIYEFVFSTSDVSLKLCKKCDAVLRTPLPVNISSSGASFFISVREGVILIGESGKAPFISWVHRTRIPFDIAYVGIASKHTTAWHFYDRFSWMRKAESWTYENWSSKEPNSYDERRACAVMKGDCDGQWSDICCSFAKSFICEKK
ncbi:hypothetical protein BSL78_12482 [Apostichopus japonicus]|uniref:C-type lectin domain-containing protein n=1 Tax=Stichopus japonicus TaxID=307972 RepID=A0A2G8KRK4_STIJA|nr:hypothetical protein BSL78_12482 [Apostichopus japonicus]